MAKADLPSIETLRNILSYDADTGKLTWLHRPRDMFKSDKNWRWWNTRYAQTEAGTSINAHGHRQIKINDRSFTAHRVAWAIHHGEWPNVIDHINGKPADNRMVNLRSVTMVENQRNQRLHSRNTSGICGVSWNRFTQKWVASVRVLDRNVHLGSYDDKQHAAIARGAANKLLGYTKRHGT